MENDPDNANQNDAGASGADAGAEASWKDNLPSDLKESPALKDVTDVSSLAKQFVDLQGYMGNTIRTPSKDATPQELAEFANKVVGHSKGKVIMAPDLTDTKQSEDFYRSLGKPETADKYKLPENLDGDPKRYDGLREQAYKLNLTNAQFQQIVDNSEANIKSRTENLSKRKADENKLLRDEWGADYDRRIKIAESILEGTDAPQNYRDLIKNGNADAATYKWLYKLSDQLAGEKVEIARQNGGARNDTPMEIRARITELEERIGVLDKESNIASRKKQSEIMKQIVELRQKLK